MPGELKASICTYLHVNLKLQAVVVCVKNIVKNTSNNGGAQVGALEQIVKVTGSL